MKDFIQRAWTPIAGAVTSLSFKAGADISQKTPEIIDSIQQAQHQGPELINYFYIGILGAIGGLLVKILWGLVKSIFPKLKILDK